ncbi:MAG TPA: amino acid permease, partial [Thermoanaerobaculia bacterium]
IGGVLLIVIALAFLGTHHNSLQFLFSFHPIANLLETSKSMAVGDRGFASPLFALLPQLRSLYAAAPALLLFVLSLLQAQWTYTGYDASAHMAEETKMARMNSAWGIVLSVGVSAVAGYLMLMVLTWCIPRGDIAATANDPYPVLFIVSSNLPAALANVIAIVIGIAMWLCGVASVTSMGRMWYAFARDDGMPGSRWLKRVSGKHQVPHVAILVTSVLSVLICVYAAAWFVVTSISTICLYLAYGIPIFLKLRHGMKAEHPWSLGRFSPVVNVIAIVWIVVIAIVFMLPPNELVLWTMLGFGALLLIGAFVPSSRA